MVFFARRVEIFFLRYGRVGYYAITIIKLWVFWGLYGKELVVGVSPP